MNVRPRLFPIRLFWLHLLLGLALFAFSAAAHARQWLRAELPGTVIYSDGYPHELQRWALKVRLIDGLLRQHLGADEIASEPGSTLTIYLLGDGKAVERLTGRKNLKGLYSSSSEGSFLVASRAPGYDRFELSGEMTLFHEYAHHFMYRHFTSAWPVWYREGQAEFVGAVRFDADWNAVIGQPAWPRMKHLTGKPMPLTTILAASVDDFPAGERARFYSWSWKLVHLLNSAPDDRDRLDRYLALFAGGMASLEAAKAAFGDLAALEARLHAYAPNPRGTGLARRHTADAQQIVVKALDPTASRLVDLRLARLLGGNPKSARAGLQALVQAAPTSAAAWRELALAERDAASDRRGKTDLAAAIAHAEAALALAPHDIRTIAVHADIVFRRLAASVSAQPADWDAARARLKNAITPATRDPYALTVFFRSYLAERRRPPPDANKAMAMAMMLQPESYEIRLFHTYSLAMQGRHEEARRAARVLASDPHVAELGKRALTVLEKDATGIPQP